MIFGCSPAMLAHESDFMRIIDHYQSAIFFSQITYAGKICDIAVHREDPISGNNFEAAIRGGLKLLLQIFHVVVEITEPLGFAEPHAVDDAGMVQLVRNN